MHRTKLAIATVFAAAMSVLVGTQSAGAAVIFSVSGQSAADIQTTVDAFRALLGTLNPNIPGSFGSGRREINWDGVPDALSAPNAFPGDFFNANTPGRARGTEFTTAGSGFQVSANAASGTPTDFGNIDPSYPGLFITFSPQRLFTSLGSNVLDVNFFVPGSNTAALTRGLGVVFTDVDLANTSSITLYDAVGSVLDTLYVPPATGNETLSFLAVDYGSSIVSRARIVSGNAPLGGPETPGIDLVVLDDFIYGEPIAAAVQVPEPSTLALFGIGLAALGLFCRKHYGA